MPYYKFSFTLLAVLVGSLVACGRGPQPFSHAETGQKNELLKLSDRSGIVVLNVQGAPEASSRRLSEEMAKSLLDRNVPAATQGGNRASNFLRGRAEVRDVDPGHVEVTVVWELVDPRGQALGTQSTTDVVDAAAWRQGARAASSGLVASSAPAIAALVQEPLPAERRDPIAGRPIKIAAIDGAPPPVERAMRRYMSDALRRAGFAFGKEEGPDIVTVDGKVQVTPERNGSKRLEIAWYVRRADGAEIGNLKQGNVVPDAELEGDWDRISWAVTTTAVDGIVDMLRGIAGSPRRASEAR